MKNTLTAGMLLLALGASAAPLSPEAALQRAVNHAVSVKKVSPANNSATSLTSRLASMKHVYGDEATGFYVFATPATARAAGASGEGYVFVGGDDVAQGILGIVEEGEWPGYDALPPQLKWMLGEYQKEIKTTAEVIAQNPGRQRILSIQSPDVERVYIYPKVWCRWNQGEPFNNDCPMDGKERSVTGCVATAMAQVMACHNWPKQATGSHSYTYSGKTYSRTFGTAPYDWAHMRGIYETGSYTDTEAAAVALLMADCGYSVDMGYTSSESGAVTARVANALSDYFGYDAAATFVESQYYSINDWNNLIWNELKTNGPVQFNGRNDFAGHSFVCDGYLGDDLFHFNWGWGGMSDGWFRLTALDPEAQGTGGSAAGYSMNTGAIINVYPDRGGDEIYIMSTDNTRPTVKLNEWNLINTAGVFNNSYRTIPYVEMGMKIVSTTTDAEPIYVKGITTRDLEEYWGWSSYNMGSVPQTLSPGTYLVYPVYRCSTDGEWQNVGMPVSGPQYFVLIVNEDKTLRVGVFNVDFPNLSLTNIEYVTPLYRGRTSRMKLTVKNQSYNEYYGTIRPAFVTEGRDSVYAWFNSMIVDIAPGETKVIDYCGAINASRDGSLPAVGSKTLTVLYDDDRYAAGFGSAEYKTAPTHASLTSTPLTLITNGNGIDAIDMKMQCTVSRKSGEYYHDHIVAYIFDGTSGKSVCRLYHPNMLIQDNSEHLAEFRGGFLGKPSYRYLAAPYQYNSNGQLTQIGNTIAFTTNSTTGIEEIEDVEVEARLVIVDNIITSMGEGVGEIVVCDMAGRVVGRGSSVNLETQPRGVYIATAILADGTCLSERFLR